MGVLRGRHHNIAIFLFHFPLLPGDTSCPFQMHLKEILSAKPEESVCLGNASEPNVLSICCHEVQLLWQDVSLEPTYFPWRSLTEFSVWKAAGC